MIRHPELEPAMSQMGIPIYCRDCPTLVRILQEHHTLLDLQDCLIDATDSVRDDQTIDQATVRAMLEADPNFQYGTASLIGKRTVDMQMISRACIDGPLTRSVSDDTIEYSCNSQQFPAERYSSRKVELKKIMGGLVVKYFD